MDKKIIYIVPNLPIKKLKVTPRLDVEKLVTNRVEQLCEEQGMSQTDFRRVMSELGINADGGHLIHSNRHNNITMSAILAILSFFDLPFNEVFDVDWEALHDELVKRIRLEHKVISE